MNIKLALSEERLKILSECMQNYDVGADTDEWANNIITLPAFIMMGLFQSTISHCSMKLIPMN